MVLNVNLAIDFCYSLALAKLNNKAYLSLARASFLWLTLTKNIIPEIMWIGMLIECAFELCLSLLIQNLNLALAVGISIINNNSIFFCVIFLDSLSFKNNYIRGTFAFILVYPFFKLKWTQNLNMVESVLVKYIMNRNVVNQNERLSYYLALQMKLVMDQYNYLI